MAEYQDEVRHINGEAIGVVIATYEKNGIKYFDVRSDDEIYYETPAENWITTVAVDE
jgi:hypothetical protein